MGFKTKISKLHYDKSAKGFTFALLKFCSLFYGVGSGLKNKFYDKGIIKPKRVNAFVLCVGNLTTGGVGKTPVVAEIANYLAANGNKVAIVSRGYGAKLSNKNVNVISDGDRIFYEADMAGDEPVWLAENSKGVCVLTCSSRYKASQYAIEKFGVTHIVLDDGFQHRKLHRDLDIVLVDSEKGFGNENLLPAGPLREGFEAFERIDKLVIVSKNIDHKKAEKFARVMGKKLKKQTSVCYTEPDFAYNIFDCNEKINDGEKVVAFSAIGQPQQFYNFLKSLDVIKTIDFDDHHIYTQADVNTLCEQAKTLVVNTLITTEKDAAKLKGLNFGEIKVFALKLKIRLDVETLLKND